MGIPKTFQLGQKSRNSLNTVTHRRASLQNRGIPCRCTAEGDSIGKPALNHSEQSFHLACDLADYGLSPQKEGDYAIFFLSVFSVCL